MLKKKEKVKVASSIHQLLKNVKKKIQELCRTVEVLKDLSAAIENKAKEARLGASAAAKEFDACFDADLSNGLEKNKEFLRAMYQDLINYKLSLD